MFKWIKCLAKLVETYNFVIHHATILFETLDKVNKLTERFDKLENEFKSYQEYVEDSMLENWEDFHKEIDMIKDQLPGLVDKDIVELVVSMGLRLEGKDIQYKAEQWCSHLKGMSKKDVKPYIKELRRLDKTLAGIVSNILDNEGR